MRDAIRTADRSGAIIARANLAMEESPESGTVEEEVGSAFDVLGKTHAARLVAAAAPGEIWVAVLATRCPWSWGVFLGPGALPVCGFGLLHACEDILRVV